jgi:hypothetical protein
VIPPVNIGRKDPVSLRGIGAAKGSPASAAAQAMTQLAGRVASAMTAHFGLAEIDPRGGYTGGSANDAYGVEELAAELTDAMGAGPKERGDIARALHEFVREGATLVVARPESRSLERLETAIADAAAPTGGTGSQVEQTIAVIDDAVLRLQGPGR